MIILCPTCKARYQVDENKIPDEGQRLKCPKCTTVFRVRKPAAQAAQAPPPPPKPAPTPPTEQPKAAAPPPPPKPAAPQPQAAAAQPQPKPAAAAKPLAAGPYKPSVPSKGTVLIGDTDDAFLKHLARVMLQNGFTVYLAHDGAVAMELIKTKTPQVAIVDVALPKIYGFEMAEMVKQDEALKDRTRMILLGSVYEKDRYRRKPQSLYGADAYIEKHHDGPHILAKVENLILGKPLPPGMENLPGAGPSPAEPPSQPASEEPGEEQAPPEPEKQKTEAAAAPAPQSAAAPSAPAASAGGAPPVPDDPEHQKAARLARTIVSDISLYNPELVTRGVQEGNIYELLAKDIDDGLKHFNGRVSDEIRSQRDYFKEAMDALIQRKKTELGL